jgi:hypothetical protein
MEGEGRCVAVSPAGLLLLSLLVGERTVPLTDGDEYGMYKMYQGLLLSSDNSMAIGA